LPGCGFWPGDGVRVRHYPCVLAAGLCDETDPEYELSDEEYIRELIDRIDGMSLRGVTLCVRCTERHPRKCEGKVGKAQCAEGDQKVEGHFDLLKAVARRTSRGIG
jgi:hypothetical protein